MITDIKYDDKEVKIFLDNLGKNIEKIEEPLEKSARYMENQAKLNFPAIGKLMSKGWKGLAESTKEYKKKYWAGKPIMVRTGLLKGSFRKTKSKISKTGGEINVYNPVEYAKYHQYGAAKLPRRILLRFQKTHITEIERIFEKWLNKIIQ